MTQRDPALRPWRAPSIVPLPKLSALTLASAIGGGGGTGGGGSTVFTLLLAAGLALGTGACHTDRDMGPGNDRPFKVTQTITCRASVTEETIDCAGPQGTAPVTIGGQGIFVEIRSRRPRYRTAQELFTFETRIENLSSQTIGTDGSTISGVNIFFVSGPTVTGGSGAISVNNADGIDNFTAAGQPYFAFAESLSTGQTSAMKVWEIAFPPTVTSFVFTVLVSAEVPDPADVLLWLPVAQFSTAELTSIAANSANDAMAVGLKGKNLRKRANGWETIPTEIAEAWVAIYAVGGGKYIGSTKPGTVAYFDGHGWQPVYETPFNVTAFGGSSTSHMAVGGNNRLAWTSDDTTWTVLADGGLGVVTGIIPFHADSFLAVTSNGTQVLVNYSDLDTVATFSSGVKYLNAFGHAGTVYGAGTYNGGPDSGSIVNRAGAVAYQASDTIPDAIEVLGGSTLWLAARSVATGNTALLSNPGFTPGGWILRGTLAAKVLDLKSNGAGGLYLIDDEGILRWDGANIVHELIGTDEHVPTVIAGRGLKAMIGTDIGVLQFYQNGGWETIDPDPTATDTIVAISMFGTDSAWVIDAVGHVDEYDGATWHQIETIADMDEDLLTFDHDNGVVVGGALTGGRIQRKAGGSWAITVNPGGGPSVPFHGVWGNGINDFWAVGAQGKVVHYTGGSYTLNGPVTTTDLYAVVGRGSDVWVAGQSGYIAYWDGATWTSCTLGAATIRDLWSPEPGRVYAVADSDAVVLTADACNAKRIRITGSGGIQHITGDAIDRIWALKDGVIYRGHD